MKNNTSRRTVLQGLMASAIVIGFDVANRSWVTSASATSLFESLPPLSGVLYTQGLRNCHKQWRGYVAPSAKQL